MSDVLIGFLVPQRSQCNQECDFAEKTHIRKFYGDIADSFPVAHPLRATIEIIDIYYFYGGYPQK